MGFNIYHFASVPVTFPLIVLAMEKCQHCAGNFKFAFKHPLPDTQGGYPSRCPSVRAVV